MTITYPLLQTPNQKFTIIIGEHSFDFQLRSFRGKMYISAAVDGVMCEAGILCVPNLDLFKNKVKTASGGNFQFVCNNIEYPTYEKLNGVDIKFIYHTED